MIKTVMVVHDRYFAQTRPGQLMVLLGVRVVGLSVLEIDEAADG